VVLPVRDQGFCRLGEGVVQKCVASRWQHCHCTGHCQRDGEPRLGTRALHNGVVRQRPDQRTAANSGAAAVGRLPTTLTIRGGPDEALCRNAFHLFSAGRWMWVQPIVAQRFLELFKRHRSVLFVGVLPRHDVVGFVFDRRAGTTAILCGVVLPRTDVLFGRNLQHWVRIER
jgi:hypothetical protein